MAHYLKLPEYGAPVEDYKVHVSMRDWALGEARSHVFGAVDPKDAVQLSMVIEANGSPVEARSACVFRRALQGEMTKGEL